MALNVGTLTAFLNVDERGLTGGLDRAQGHLSRAGSAMGTAAKVAGGAIAAGLVGAATLAIGGLVKDSIDSIQRIERINAQTASAIKATGGAAKVTADHIVELTGNLEGMTATEAESIQNGANMLLTFTNIQNGVGKGNDIFDQATKTITDMSRAMDTTGDAVIDTTGTALQLGKALNDPIKGITALSRVGVSFSDEQKNTIKTMVANNDTMGAQKVILGELQKEFGGAGETFANTTKGKIELAGHAWGTFGEAVVQSMLTPFSKVATISAAVLNDAATKFPDFQAKVGDAIAPIADRAKQVFGDVKTAAMSVYDLLVKGDFTSAFGNIFHVEEDSKVVGFLFGVRDAVMALPGVFSDTKDSVKLFYDALTGGDVSSDLPWASAITTAAYTVRNSFDAVKGAAETVAPIVGALVGGAFTLLWPVLQDVGTFLIFTLVPGLFTLANAIAQNVVPAIASVVSWFNEHRTTTEVLAGVIGALLIPILISVAGQAVISGATIVGTWIAAKVAAVQSSIAQVVAHYRVVAGWVASAAAAVASGAETVAIWALYKIEAIKGAAASAISAARVVASWIAMQAGAVASGAVIAAQWVVAFVTGAATAVASLAVTVATTAGHWIAMGAQAVASGAVIAAQWIVGFVTGAATAVASMAVSVATLVGGWIAMGAQAVASAAVIAAQWAIGFVVGAATAVASMAVSVATVVGGWIIMGAQAMLQAARMAAAWLIAMGPIGWIIAGVIALTAIVVANWDTISGALSSGWNWVKDNVFSPIASFVTQTIPDAFRAGIGFIKDHWQLLLPILLGPIGPAVALIVHFWDPIKAFFTETLPGWVKSGIGFIGDLWDGLTELAKKPIRFLIDTVFNKGILPLYNKAVSIPGVPGDPISDFKLPSGFATGGLVRGPGTGTSDEIPAWLSNREFVVNAAATAQWLPLLQAINGGTLAGGQAAAMALLMQGAPGFALGGLVGLNDSKVRMKDGSVRTIQSSGDVSENDVAGSLGYVLNSPTFSAMRVGNGLGGLLRALRGRGSSVAAVDPRQSVSADAGARSVVAARGADESGSGQGDFTVTQYIYTNDPAEAASQSTDRLRQVINTRG